jgi:hypothetical protein
VPYTQSRARRHGSKVRYRSRTMRAMGYFAVGDLSSDLASGQAALQAALASGTTFGGSKAGGFVSKYVAPVLGGASSLVSMAKSSAPAAAAPTGYMTRVPGTSLSVAPAASSGVFGIPTTYLLLGGAGVAALLLLRKKH